MFFWENGPTYLFGPDEILRIVLRITSPRREKRFEEKNKKKNLFNLDHEENPKHNSPNAFSIEIYTWTYHRYSVSRFKSLWPIWLLFKIKMCYWDLT